MMKDRIRTEPIRFLIVDDHGILREGLKLFLSTHFPNAVFGESSTSTAAMQMVSEGIWDLLILDLAMPGRSGIEGLVDLKALKPELPILILTAYPEEQYAVRALNAGASGYLMKNYAPVDLLDAVDKVVAGGRFVSPTLASHLVQQLQRESDPAPHERLSDREFLLLKMVARGLTLREAAQELDLAESTIESCHNRLLAKMKMRSDVELTRYAFQNNLAD